MLAQSPKLGFFSRIHGKGLRLNIEFDLGIHDSSLLVPVINDRRHRADENSVA